MGIFFCLGDAELALSCLCDCLSEGVLHIFLVKEDVHALEFVIVWGEAAVVERKGLHAEVRQVFLCEHGGELPCPVVSEIEENHCIAFPDCPEGIPFGVSD